MKTMQLNKVDYNRYAEGQDLEPQVATTPVMIQVATVRCYYPRKSGRPGTRITFTDGGGFAVAESFDEVTAAGGFGDDCVRVAAPAAPAVLAIAGPAAPTDTAH